MHANDSCSHVPSSSIFHSVHCLNLRLNRHTFRDTFMAKGCNASRRSSALALCIHNKMTFDDGVNKFPAIRSTRTAWGTSKISRGLKFRGGLINRKIRLDEPWTKNYPTIYHRLEFRIMNIPRLNFNSATMRRWNFIRWIISKLSSAESDLRGFTFWLREKC